MERERWRERDGERERERKREIQRKKELERERERERDRWRERDGEREMERERERITIAGRRDNGYQQGFSIYYFASKSDKNFASSSAAFLLAVNCVQITLNCQRAKKSVSCDVTHSFR
jgi:hypothetical protein